jgi:O-antigen ligase
MDLICVLIFQAMYYLRPQEWFGLVNKIHFAQIVMITAVATLFFRERPVRLKDFLSTPHDWAVLLFWIWIVVASPSPWHTFKESYNLPAMYFIMTHTVFDVRRIKIFLGFWMALIVFVSALAVASAYGFDPFLSNDITMGKMKGRLILNLSIFNNPNALGHNVVMGIPMLYFLLVWRRPLFVKELGYGLMIIPLACIYMTVSKGAFLVGAATILATMTFGRPKWMQASVIALALAFGGTALYALPRMTELNKAKTDEAIQGRVAAFTHGLNVVERSYTGVGFQQWMVSFRDAHSYSKAAHSSYVQIGTELGKTGFALMLAICYCNLRTLVTSRTATDDEERLRRTLFVIVLAYMFSSWMVDFGYRTTFFMMTAATAAFHRHLIAQSRPEEEVEAETAAAEAPKLPAWRGRLMPVPDRNGALASVGAPALMTLEPERPAIVARRIVREDEVEEKPAASILGRWNRIGLFDIAAIIVFTWLMIRFWHIAVQRM